VRRDERRAKGADVRRDERRAKGADVRRDERRAKGAEDGAGGTGWRAATLAGPPDLTGTGGGQVGGSLAK